MTIVADKVKSTRRRAPVVKLKVFDKFASARGIRKLGLMRG